MKNPTPQTLSLYSALFISGFNLIFCISQQINWFTTVIFLVAGFLLSFSVFFYFLNFLIYRKIKVIYKVINRFKAGKFSEFRFQYNNDVIDAVSRDVEQWAEDQSKEILELQSNAQYRKEFLGNVSHELKTPVFNIQGYISTLLDGGLNDPKIAEKFLHKALENTERMELLINDLMEISKLESGNIELKSERFDVYSLIDAVIDSLEERADERKISIEFKTGLNPPFFVEADRKLIQQAVINLIENSVKYGREGGKTQIGIYDMDKRLLIEISDDGEGISPEHLPRLFERFYRVDKARSRGAGGTGLGLAIVKHIMDAHGQSIDVRSTVGVGTTFGFTLQKASSKK